MTTVSTAIEHGLARLVPPYHYHAPSRLATTDVTVAAPTLISATEPTALAAIALYGHGRVDRARTAADQLAQLQQSTGFVGIAEYQNDAAMHLTPRWPTSLALLAWCVVGKDDPARYADNIQRAADALLTIAGAKIEPTPDIGHDTQLVGWPWVDGTHSWIEPTCLAVLGLKAAGYTDHPRVREAVRLLRDRQIHGGAWNCGNTVVLGQTQANHVQPTGMALVALAGEDDPRHRNASAVRYLLRALQRGTGTASMCWAWHGLAAENSLPPSLAHEIAMTTTYVLQRDASPYKLALLGLAALGNNSPLITHTHSPGLATAGVAS